MDLSSAFRTEVFRPVATIAIPGAVAITPYVFVARHFHQFVSNTWERHPNAAGIGVAFAVIGAGLILEDLGSRVEVFWDHHLGEEFSKIESEWFDYLMIALTTEPIGQRYLRTITLRLKFELGLAMALPVMWAGVLWLDKIVDLWTDCGFFAFTVLTTALIGYLLYESRGSAKMLAKLRSRLVKQYRAQIVA